MNKNELYDVWWTDRAEGEQRMEAGHDRLWYKVLNAILETDLHGQTILDFGCNQGGFLRFLYGQRPFAQGVGVDLARQSVEIANQRKGDLPLTYVVTNSLAAYPAQFDLAISSAVIYLIQDLADHAAQMRHALKPGGVYYATYTDYAENPSLPAMKQRIDQYGAVPMQLHTLDELAQAFLEAGFSVGIQRMLPTDYIPLNLPERFFQNVADGMQYEYEQAYIFRFVLPSSSQSI